MGKITIKSELLDGGSMKDVLKILGKPEYAILQYEDLGLCYRSGNFNRILESHGIPGFALLDFRGFRLAFSLGILVSIHIFDADECNKYYEILAEGERPQFTVRSPKLHILQALGRFPTKISPWGEIWWIDDSKLMFPDGLNGELIGIHTAGGIRIKCVDKSILRPLKGGLTEAEILKYFGEPLSQPLNVNRYREDWEYKITNFWFDENELGYPYFFYKDKMR